MIKNSKHVYVYPVKASNLIVDANTISIQDGQNLLNEYLAKGYALYDIYSGGTSATSAGFERLLGTSATSTSAVCVFCTSATSASTGTYTMSSAFLGGLVSVVVLDLLIDSMSSKTVTAVCNGTWHIDFTSAADYTNYNLKFEMFRGLSIDLNSVNITGLTLYNNYIVTYNMGSSSGRFINCNIDYCRFLHKDNYNDFYFTIAKTLTHNIFMNNDHNGQSLRFIGDATNIVTFINCYFLSGYTVNLTQFTASDKFDFINCYTRGITQLLSDNTNSNPIRHYNSGSIITNTGNYPIIYTDENIDLTTLTDYFYYWQEDILLTLSTTYLPPTNTGFIRTPGIIDTEYRINYTIFAKLNRNYYTINFQRGWKIDDDIKKFNADMIWVIRKDEIETDLVTSQKYIKNLGIYTTSAADVEYSYTNDENFMMFIQTFNPATSQNESHIVAWYNDAVRKTIYTNPKTDIVYTILGCFQLWEIDKIDGVRNLVNCTDSPLEGSITFNNFDNEIVV